MMCKKRNQPSTQKWIPHFYRILIKVLTQPNVKHMSYPLRNSRILNSIFSNGSNLFTLSLPGSTILIPSFIACSKEMVSICLTTVINAPDSKYCEQELDINARIFDVRRKPLFEKRSRNSAKRQWDLGSDQQCRRCFNQYSCIPVQKSII